MKNLNICISKNIWANDGMGRHEGLKIPWAVMPVQSSSLASPTIQGALAQLTRASDLHSEGREFESHTLHNLLVPVAQLVQSTSLLMRGSWFRVPSGTQVLNQQSYVISRYCFDRLQMKVPSLSGENRDVWINFKPPFLHSNIYLITKRSKVIIRAVCY